MYNKINYVNNYAIEGIMKRIVSVLIIVITCGLIVFGLFKTNKKEEYIRIHVRANSNQEIDQNIKYKVKDEIVKYLIPYVAECEKREEFIAMLECSLNNIKKVADKVLKDNNFSYESSIEFKEENFPTRSYDGVVLETGIYDSIIVKLGTGTGDNWWCVVYPPLCFVSNSSTNIMYKSRILEILKSILK